MLCGGKVDYGMTIKTSLSERIFDIINIIFMLFLMVIMFYPMWYVFCASFSDNRILMAHEGLLFYPIKFNLVSYKAVFSNPMIMHGYKNTILILVISLIINMVMTSIAAYVLSRKTALLNKAFMRMIVFTMYFSGGLIPHYLLITRTLHLDNNFWALILPASINTYNLIILKTSFMGIPESLHESATLDGAGHWTILFRIVLPLSKAILAVIALYYLVAVWNSWFPASIYLKDRAKYPLQLVLREILIQNDVSAMTQGTADSDQQSLSETVKYAVIIVATVPILIFYPFLQKYFVKGTFVGAVKG